MAQKREEVQNWFRQLLEWTERAVTPEVYGQWLIQALVQIVEANAGALWVTGRRSWFQRHVAVLTHCGVTAETLNHRSHLRLLRRVWRNRQPFAAGAHWSGHAWEGANPTASLLLVAPVMQANKPRALIELLQRPAMSDLARRGYLRLLEQVCDIASRSSAFGRLPE